MVLYFQMMVLIGNIKIYCALNIKHSPLYTLIKLQGTDLIPLYLSARMSVHVEYIGYHTKEYFSSPGQLTYKPVSQPQFVYYIFAYVGWYL